jgi:glycosyltransferase involved in cell wall biosynthesis
MNNDSSLLVSVIVPVYNAGDRICRCLDTLTGQTLREIEIICVLDCPTDGTDRIVETYAKKDSRIVIVRNERNLHVSGSRNAGIRVARGKYIGFSDHDDYRAEDMYEQLYRKAEETGADIVVSDVTVISEDRNKEVWRYGDCSKAGLIRSLVLPFDSKSQRNKPARTCWNGIYRRSLLAGMAFHNRSEVFEEDIFFNLEAIQKAGTISYVTKPFYVWDKHLGSESNRIYPHGEICHRQIGQARSICSFLGQKGLLSEYRMPLCLSIYWNVWRYFPYYENLADNDVELFRSILSDTRFPLLAKMEKPWFSKKRPRLFFFLLKSKIYGSIHR